MISARFAPVIFGFVLSALMSFIVSGIATLRTAGPGIVLTDGFINLWLGAWLPSWMVAFPVVLVVAPLARKAVSRMVRQ
ncbi:DUF2798 domain-containing protein [Ferrovibrio terrae]|uniref:DUF2798 domain-containing protein n=1 Tax=Ferrovibrio terrae TaxID=2594003 RepID=A0A516H5E5_9PROT|nr:DUF2798 domain-containing protein [Ferrovibrio terrae]QDO99019.1 DUF2798 domain-containing protein [Ferrovibrio terrae]